VTLLGGVIVATGVGVVDGNSAGVILRIQRWPAHAPTINTIPQPNTNRRNNLLLSLPLKLSASSENVCRLPLQQLESQLSRGNQGRAMVSPQSQN
jgi:hypothetical protein